MNIQSIFSAALSIALTLIATTADARGFKGGGGGGGGFRGGGGGGGFSRPASMPHLGGGGGGFSRPNVSMPSNFNRPNFNRPNVNRPNVSRPNVSRPVVTPGSNRPGAGSSITGGLKPSTRPATRPSITDRPNLSKPNLPRPDASRPDASRPNVSRPVTRPSNPSLGGRPSLRPDGNRPSIGKLDDFLGIDRPLTLPGRVPGQLPGRDRPIANRPGVDRPNINRPGVSRPDLGNAVNNRPINIDKLNVGNTVINNRPSWVNIDRDRVNTLQQNWGHQIGGLHSYTSSHATRMNRWHDHAKDIRFRWDGYHHHGNWFAGDWWYSHPGGLSRWHYYHSFNRHPWRYWWTVPTFAVATSWFTWQAPVEVWTEPIYYDYGMGDNGTDGNVTYQDNRVYINGEPVASADDFAESTGARHGHAANG